MQHSFSQVPKAEIQRSSFKRNKTLKTTLDAGYLVPILVEEVLPGDTHNLNMNALARLATPLHPFMDNVYIDTFFFFVPNRLVWDNWVKMMGEQVNPDDSTDYVTPELQSPVTTGWAEQSIADYFGLPIGVESLVVSALPFRAYNLIWNEWFRDQNLQDSLVVDRDDGPDDNANYTLQRRGKRHDYFTSCLPWPQKGDEVPLPLGTQAPIKFTSLTGENPRIRNAQTGAFVDSVSLNSSNTHTLSDTTGTATTYLALEPRGTLYADLTFATAATINVLREAFQVQRLLERDARGGTRYTEILRAHFGVVSPDARLQRPEYLGGSSQPFNVNPIAQTSATATEPTPQGNLAAMATASFTRGHGFVKSFTEHGFIIGLASVRADMTYQQGIPKMFLRSGRYDYYWPALAHLGEQAVLSHEIYADGSGDDFEVFGYQERFAEYRYNPSQITGKFRSQAASSLDTWHLAQDFATRPVLNAEFIVENPPLARVLAVEDEPEVLLDAYFEITSARPMPMFGVPGLIDHF